MSWRRKARSVARGAGVLWDGFAGEMVWAAEPGRGSPLGRIAVEQAQGQAGYLVRADGVVLGRSRDLERALSLARRIEADAARAVRLREQRRATV